MNSIEKLEFGTYLRLAIRIIAIATTMHTQLHPSEPAPVTESAKGILEVSRVEAVPSHLSCSSASKATATVQIAFVKPLPAVDTEKLAQITVMLSEKATSPPRNFVQVSGPRTISLPKKSPAVAVFEILCSKGTQVGEGELLATVTQAPKTYKINISDPPENAQFKLLITK